MTLACPVDLDSIRLRREVREMYSRVAVAPDGAFHFHRGPEYAVEWLGYDAAELAELPPEVTHPFAGVGNPHAVAALPSGASVVDIGSGAGTDLLLAARHVGSAGRATGIYDCFRGTSKQATARKFGVIGVNLSGVRA